MTSEIGLAQRLRSLSPAADDVMLWGWCTLGSAFAAETVGRRGADVVCVDVEHGFLGWDGALALVQTLTAGQIPTVVRLSGHDPVLAMQVLDAGADGVVVPHVESAAEAASAAMACRYPPSGSRSWGPTRAALLGRRELASVNAAVACIPMVETAAAVDRLTEIVATDGVDAVIVGANDLAFDLIGPAQSIDAVKDSAEFAGLLEQAAATCRLAGVPAGAPYRSVEEAHSLVEAGYKILILPSDAATLASATARQVSELGLPSRSRSVQPATVGY